MSQVIDLDVVIGKDEDGNEIRKRLTIKQGNKKNVVVGGPALGQRFPVTLYAPSWLILLEHADEIKKYIQDNVSELSWARE